MSQSIYDNIICAKFDRSLEHPITMYDNLPYKRDTDYCNAEKLALQSGRVIKYYLCLNQMEKLPIDNHDGEIESILASIQAQESKRVRIVEKKTVIPETQDGITPEQIQTLLTDPDTENAEQSVDSASFIDSLDDVEDW